MWPFKKKEPKQDVAISQLSEKFDQLVDILSQENNVDTASPPDIMEKFEILERRFENLHNDCLKYLKKGASAEARAKALRANQFGDEDMDEEEGPIGVQMPLPLTQQQPESEPQNDLDWAMHQLRKNGEVPII